MPSEHLSGLLRHAIRIAPQRLKTRLIYAQFLTSVGRPDDAEVQLDYVLQVDPSNRAARLGQARLLERRGDHEAAVQALTPYIRADMRGNTYCLLSITFMLYVH